MSASSVPSDMDVEVGNIMTSQGLSRDSSMGSHSRAATETPSEDFSDDSDSDTSSPINVG